MSGFSSSTRYERNALASPSSSLILLMCHIFTNSNGHYQSIKCWRIIIYYYYTLHTMFTHGNTDGKYHRHSEVISHLAHEQTNEPTNSNRFFSFYVLRKREVSKYDLWWNLYMKFILFSSHRSFSSTEKNKRQNETISNFAMLCEWRAVMQCMLKWCCLLCGDIIDRCKRLRLRLRHASAISFVFVKSL